MSGFVGDGTSDAFYPVRPTRAQFIAELRKSIGEPYNKSGGQACGGNCLGRLIHSARETGGLERLVAAAEPHLGHALPPNRFALLLALRRHAHEIKPSKALPGDLLLFNVGGEPRHLAVITEPGVILHADAGARNPKTGKASGLVVEHALPSSWRPTHAFRIPELT